MAGLPTMRGKSYRSRRSIALKPTLSIVVNFYNMSREAERTLHSLSVDYQSDVSEAEYEIIAIDNGSTHPLNGDRVGEFGANFKYHRFETESKSPVSAINFGASIASSEFIAVIVDGARMVSPGLISTSLKALQAFDEPFVGALSWHLGPDVQNVSICNGYNQTEEDRLLESIDWRTNGYRLFEISTLSQSSQTGYFGGFPPELSWLAMRRTTFHELGAYDDRFQSPGGGLMNHEFVNRVSLRPGICPIILLGEGSFHQIHGGIATNVPIAEHPIYKFKEEYQRILGRSYERVSPPEPYYLGRLRPETMRFVGNGVTKG